MSQIRKLAKRVFEEALSALVQRSNLTNRNRERSLILAYHNIRPDDSRPVGEFSAHITFSALKTQLDLLQEYCEVVPLSCIGTSTGTPANRPRVALTFDDAYSGAIELGLPEIARRGMPATMFVAPTLLNGQQFWWDQLANRTSGIIPPSLREAALTRFEGRGAQIVSWASAEGYHLNVLPEFARGASISSVKSAARLPTVSWGAHTWSHPNLGCVFGQELEFELTEPLKWLRANLDVAPTHSIAYPYGLYTAATEESAKRLSFTQRLLVVGGWCQKHPDFDSPLPRLNVSAGITDRGFILRLAGLA